MFRMCVLTVLMETWSSRAISGRVRFVGRYRSTRSSLGLSCSGCERRSRSMLGAGCTSQQVDDVGEKGAMSRFVTRERVE